MVMTAERLSDFMLEDGRHVHRRAVDYILQQFLLRYAEKSLHPAIDEPDWLTAPSKTDTRPAPTNPRSRFIAKARSILPDVLEERVVQLSKEIRKSVKS
jgi:hypothetical protein